MDWRYIAYILYLAVQLALIGGLLYFSMKVMYILYTMSPFYKGKTPYVPSTRGFVKKGYELLDVREGEKVVDIGSGDGQVVLYGARRYNAEFVGVEINKVLWLLARFKALFVRKVGSVSFVLEDYMEFDLGDANKVFVFGLPSNMEELVGKLEKELKPGVRIVSAMFKMAGKRLMLVKEEKACGHVVYLYEVKWPV